MKDDSKCAMNVRVLIDEAHMFWREEHFKWFRVSMSRRNMSLTDY